MSRIMLADPIAMEDCVRLERLGYSLGPVGSSIPITRVMGLGMADYLVVVGRQLSLQSAMLLGAAVVLGVKIVVIDPVPDVLELVPAPACAYICATWDEAIKGFFSKMVNANFEARSRNANRREM